MKKLLMAAVAVAAFTGAAQAQDSTSDAAVSGSFGGFRIEGNIGYDQAQAFGQHNRKLGYGGSAGFDGNLTSRIVVGPEVSYWRPNAGHSFVESRDGVVAQEAGDTWGGAVRIGFRVTPDLLVFGKGGYVNQSQHTYFVNAAGDNARSGGHADGYQAGGGFQYAPHDRFSFAPANLYLSGQYVYENFSNHTADQHAMAGVGLRFR